MPFDPYISETLGHICIKFMFLGASFKSSVILSELLPLMRFLRCRFLSVNSPKCTFMTPV